MNIEDVKPGQKFSYEGMEGTILQRLLAPVGSAEEWVVYDYGICKKLSAPLSLWLATDVLAIPADLPRGYQPELAMSKCECGADSVAGLSGHHSSWCPKSRSEI